MLVYHAINELSLTKPSYNVKSDDKEVTIKANFKKGVSLSKYQIKDFETKRLLLTKFLSKKRKKAYELTINYDDLPEESEKMLLRLYDSNHEYSDFLLDKPAKKIVTYSIGKVARKNGGMPMFYIDDLFATESLEGHCFKIFSNNTTIIEEFLVKNVSQGKAEDYLAGITINGFMHELTSGFLNRLCWGEVGDKLIEFFTVNSAIYMVPCSYGDLYMGNELHSSKNIGFLMPLPPTKYSINDLFEKEENIDNFTLNAKNYVGLQKNIVKVHDTFYAFNNKQPYCMVTYNIEEANEKVSDLKILKHRRHINLSFFSNCIDLGYNSKSLKDFNLAEENQEGTWTFEEFVCTTNWKALVANRNLKKIYCEHPFFANTKFTSEGYKLVSVNNNYYVGYTDGTVVHEHIYEKGEGTQVILDCPEKEGVWFTFMKHASKTQHVSINAFYIIDSTYIVSPLIKIYRRYENEIWNEYTFQGRSNVDMITIEIQVNNDIDNVFQYFKCKTLAGTNMGSYDRNDCLCLANRQTNCIIMPSYSLVQKTENTVLINFVRPDFNLLESLYYEDNLTLFNEKDEYGNKNTMYLSFVNFPFAVYMLNVKFTLDQLRPLLTPLSSQ